jgi:hypothetical protein
MVELSGNIVDDEIWNELPILLVELPNGSGNSEIGDEKHTAFFLTISGFKNLYYDQFIKMETCIIVASHLHNIHRSKLLIRCLESLLKQSFGIPTTIY